MEDYIRALEGLDQILYALAKAPADKTDESLYLIAENLSVVIDGLRSYQ